MVIFLIFFCHFLFFNIFFLFFVKNSAKIVIMNFIDFYSANATRHRENQQHVCLIVCLSGFSYIMLIIPCFCSSLTSILDALLLKVNQLICLLSYFFISIVAFKVVSPTYSCLHFSELQLHVGYKFNAQ